MNTTSFRDEKEALLQSLVREEHLKTPRIIDAFRAIDRKDFVLSEYAGEAYGNYPLPIGYGQTISQPLTVAFMLELLDPKSGERIMDAGSGSGWTTALLAHIVGKSGRVVATERIPELCTFGEKKVRKYNFIKKGIARFICGDATRVFEGTEKFDKILAGAAAQDAIPEAWKKCLVVGGRIVAPVGQSVVVLDKIAKDKFTTKEYSGFSFVPLIKD